MIRKNRLSASAITLLLGNALIPTANSAESAPFRSEIALETFSRSLIGEIANTNLDSAKSIARNNSHLDDEITQRNLQDVFFALKHLVGDGQTMESRFVQQSKFGRSFIRHQYSLSNAELTIRCMLTYRRKTAGWRLNQLWCS